MAMQMLEAGGMAVFTDGRRVADENNPAGYYECERVKTLDRDLETTWLEGVRGKAIKIVSYFLPHLPDTNQYRVIFMHRNLDEVIASQRAMLAAAGAVADTATDERVAAAGGGVQAASRRREGTAVGPHNVPDARGRVRRGAGLAAPRGAANHTFSRFRPRRFLNGSGRQSNTSPAATVSSSSHP
jgi:hypothetical protein